MQMELDENIFIPGLDSGHYTNAGMIQEKSLPINRNFDSEIYIWKISPINNRHFMKIVSFTRGGVGFFIFQSLILDSIFWLPSLIISMHSFNILDQAIP